MSLFRLLITLWFSFSYLDESRNLFFLHFQLNGVQVLKMFSNTLWISLVSCNIIQDVIWTDIPWCHCLWLFVYVDNLTNVELVCQHIEYRPVPGCGKSWGTSSCSAEMFRSALSNEPLWWTLAGFSKSPLSVDPNEQLVIISSVVQDGRGYKGVHRNIIVRSLEKNPYILPWAVA